MRPLRIHVAALAVLAMTGTGALAQDPVSETTAAPPQHASLGFDAELCLPHGFRLGAVPDPPGHSDATVALDVKPDYSLVGASGGSPRECRLPQGDESAVLPSHYALIRSGSSHN